MHQVLIDGEDAVGRVVAEDRGVPVVMVETTGDAKPMPLKAGPASPALVL